MDVAARVAGLNPNPFGARVERKVTCTFTCGLAIREGGVVQTFTAGGVAAFHAYIETAKSRDE